jgi:hypothetical protein
MSPSGPSRRNGDVRSYVSSWGQPGRDMLSLRLVGFGSPQSGCPAAHPSGWRAAVRARRRRAGTGRRELGAAPGRPHGAAARQRRDRHRRRRGDHHPDADRRGVRQAVGFPAHENPPVHHRMTLTDIASRRVLCSNLHGHEPTNGPGGSSSLSRRKHRKRLIAISPSLSMVPASYGTRRELPPKSGGSAVTEQRLRTK